MRHARLIEWILALCLILLMVWPSGVASASSCGMAARPAIHITVREEPVEFDLSQTAGDLGQMDFETATPYPSSYHATIGGLMNGDIAVNHRVKFSVHNEGGKGCFTVSGVYVEIVTKPTIFIASDFQNRTCWFKEIFMHEAKHVEIDRAVIRKYESRFVDGMNMIFFDTADYSSGWMSIDDLDGAKQDMHASIEMALQTLFDVMLRERRELQQNVDSEYEYKRVGRACHSASS